MKKTTQKSKKPVSITEKIWKIIFGIILLLPVLFITYFLLMFIIQGPVKMGILNYHAVKLQNELAGFSFINNRSTNAAGVIEGDMLTANPDPKSSVFAQATFTSIDKPLATIEGEVALNLAKSGFTREGPDNNPYYSLNQEGKYITFRYIKNDKAIRVMYQLDNRYSCPENYVCENTGADNPKSYNVRGFGKIQVKSMRINYSDKSSDYHSGY